MKPNASGRLRYLSAVVVGVVAIVVGIELVLTAFGNVSRHGAHVRALVDDALFTRSAFEALVDEETGVRGYVATGDPVFLEPYHAGRTTFIRFRSERMRLNDRLADAALVQFRAAADTLQPYFAAQIDDVRDGRRDVAIRHLPAGRAAFDAFRRRDDGLSRVIALALDADRSGQRGALAAAEAVTFGFGGLLVAGTVLALSLLRQARGAAVLARSDALTSLPNRRAFEERLARVLGEGDARAGILFVDLDRFKPVNDAYGHAAGDALLAACGRRIRSVVRPGDLVARIGGDEFGVILTGVTETSQAQAVAERIRTAIAQPFAFAGTMLAVGASIGIAIAPADGSEPAALLGSADAAMYRVKHERTVTR